MNAPKFYMLRFTPKTFLFVFLFFGLIVTNKAQAETSIASDGGCRVSVEITINLPKEVGSYYYVKVGDDIPFSVTAASSNPAPQGCGNDVVRNIEVTTTWDNAGADYGNSWNPSLDYNQQSSLYSSKISAIGPVGGHVFASTVKVYMRSGRQLTMGAYPITINVTGEATVNINKGNCDPNTQWTASSGHDGKDAGSFKFTPSSSGTNVSLTVTPVSGIGSANPASQMVYYNGTYVFTMDCRTANPPPKVILASDPSQISCAQPKTTISWASENVDSCGDINVTSTTGGTTSGSRQVGAGTYSISCVHASGMVVKASVNNNLDNVSCPISTSTPSVTVTASPATVPSGGESTITWSSSTGISSCASDWWSSSTSLSSSVTVKPNTTTTYIKTCTDTNGVTRTGSVTVTVSAAASVTLTPAYTPITKGGAVTLTWSGSNVSSCSATSPNNWNSSTATYSQKSVSPTKTEVYTVTCVSNVGGTNPTASATVVVGEDEKVASVNINPPSATYYPGGPVVLSWLGENVSSCTGTTPANWTSSSAITGSKSVTPSQTTTYTITCTSSVGGNNPSASAIVTYGTGPTVVVESPIAGGVLAGSALIKGYVIPANGTTITNVQFITESTPVVRANSASNPSFFPVAGTGGNQGFIYNFDTSVLSDGDHNMIINATDSNGRTKSNTVPVKVSNDASIDYTLSNNGLAPITKGSVDKYGTVTVTKSLKSGTPRSITLSLSGVPVGVDYTPFTNGNCAPTCNSSVTFTVHSTSPTGTFPVTVVGMPGGKTTGFTLDIRDSTTPVVTCSRTPSGSVLVGQPVTWTGAVNPAGSYTYVWSGTNLPTPAPTTSSFTTTYSTVGTKTATMTATNGSGNGFCTGTVQVNFNPNFKEF